MSQVRKQLQKFVAEQLQPNDLVAVIRTGGEMGALQQFTNDRRILTRAVDQLHWNICSRAGINVLKPVSSLNIDPGIPGCGMRSYSSTLKSLRFIVDSLGYLPGRKSLVLLSDSIPREAQDEYFSQKGVLEQAGIVQDDSTGFDPDAINYRESLNKIAEKAIRASVVI